MILFTCINIACFAAIVYGLWRHSLHLFKRLDNADSRIVRLENAMDSIMQGKAAMAEPNNVVKLRCKPDPKCPLCYGRGHVGKNLETGLHVVCRCCA